MRAGCSCLKSLLCAHGECVLLHQDSASFLHIRWPGPLCGPPVALILECLCPESSFPCSCGLEVGWSLSTSLFLKFWSTYYLWIGLYIYVFLKNGNVLLNLIFISQMLMNMLSSKSWPGLILIVFIFCRWSLNTSSVSLFWTFLGIPKKLFFLSFLSFFFFLFFKNKWLLMESFRTWILDNIK